MSSSSPQIAFRTDGNTRIGLGHLVECLNVARRLKECYGLSSLFIVGHDTVRVPEIEELNLSLYRLPSGIDFQADAEETLQILKRRGIRLLVTNLRDVGDPYVQVLEQERITVICIDEWGNKRLRPDVIVNGSVVEDWHRYDTDGEKVACYFGPQFMIMADIFADYHDRPKTLAADSPNVLVSMGGVDRSGATLHAMEALSHLSPGIRKTIVIGPAFQHEEALAELLATVERGSFDIVYAPDNLASLFFSADVTISAGGNTLYELACVGTPALIVYEDEHERVQGKAFEQLGAAIALGKGTEVPLQVISQAVVSLLSDPGHWTATSRRGKALVDGRGVERVCDIIVAHLDCVMITQSKPTVGTEEAQAVYEVVLSGQLAQSKLVETFEAKMAHFIGVKHAVATNSGTAALHLALLALGVGTGDEVLLPSYVCTALLNAIHYVGAQPVMVDIGEDYNISAEDAKRKLTAQAKAIIVPHMFGRPADLEALLALGIPLIEDCAHSVGAKYRGRPIGSFGAVAILSFYATKMLTTGEGGMVITNKAELASQVQDRRDYDMKPQYVVRYNYKMTDIQAAIGLQQLKKLPGFVARRREIAARYIQEVAGLNVGLPVGDDHRESVRYRFVVRVQQNLDALIAQLEARGVICDRPVFLPLHRYLGYVAADFPGTEEAFRTALSVPIYPSLSDQEVDQVIIALRQVLSDGSKIA